MQRAVLRRVEFDLGFALGAVFVSVGALAGAGRLNDNSFFTHLATGRLILESGSVPGSDPYTYTAAGEPWVVQSWLVSLLYAASERAIGLAGPRLMHGALAAGLALGIWWLTRTAPTVLVRAGVTGLVLLASGLGWSERPLMVGLVCFVATWWGVDRARVHWLLLPVAWVWVNSHGSFPLGAVLVAMLCLGRYLDGGEWRPLLRGGVWWSAGVLLGGVVSPVGIGLLTFPLGIFESSELLGAVEEWQSPDFSTLGAIMFLLVLLLSMVAVRRVTSWEKMLPLLVFATAGLLAARNMVLAELCAAPLLAAAAPNIGSLRHDERGSFRLQLLCVSVLLGLVAAVTSLSGPHLDLRGYPAASIEFMEDQGLLSAGGDVRIVHSEVVGGYLEFRYGATGMVFIDDRFMGAAEDLFSLHRGQRVLEILDRYQADFVLWEENSAVSEILEAASGWRSYGELPDEDWRLFVREP